MDLSEHEKARISLRLKAGRHLAAAAMPGETKALTTAQLAKHPLLRKNGITENRLEEVEQRRTVVRPMELEKIATALGLPADWFSRADPVRRTPDPFDEMERALADLGLTLAPWQVEDAEVVDDMGRLGSGEAGDDS